MVAWTIFRVSETNPMGHNEPDLLYLITLLLNYYTTEMRNFRNLQGLWDQPLQVKEIEEACRTMRKDNGKTIIGFQKLKETDPRSRPKNPKGSGPEPLCHASDKETAKEYKKRWRVFRDAYIQASADYRNGVFDRDFPDGSFRPPLVEIFMANAP